MPNIVMNQLRIQGTVDRVLAALSELMDAECVLDENNKASCNFIDENGDVRRWTPCENIMPQPDNDEYIVNSLDGLKWRYKNWGCKWEPNFEEMNSWHSADMRRICDEHKDEFFKSVIPKTDVFVCDMRFNSPWGPAIGISNAIYRKYPDLKVLHAYTNEFNSLNGIYKNGRFAHGNESAPTDYYNMLWRPKSPIHKFIFMKLVDEMTPRRNTQKYKQPDPTPMLQDLNILTTSQGENIRMNFLCYNDRDCQKYLDENNQKPNREPIVTWFKSA